MSAVQPPEDGRAPCGTDFLAGRPGLAEATSQWRYPRKAFAREPDLADRVATAEALLPTGRRLRDRVS